MLRQRLARLEGMLFAWTVVAGYGVADIALGAQRAAADLGVELAELNRQVEAA